MRVALIHNRSAGQERLYSTGDLTGLLRDAGFRVEVYGSRKSDVRRAVDDRPDVMVVAGGDGTVAKTAAAVHKADASIPLFILPVGTSNNIARSLGISGVVPALVKALASAPARRLDVGEASGSWSGDREVFIEGAGFGFIGTMLERDGSIPERIARTVRDLFHPRRSERERSARGMARLILAQRPVACRVIADGEDLSGEYISAEVMNIREIGPRVRLAPGADAGDGLFDLVLTRAEDRAALADQVQARTQRAGTVPGIVRRVRSADIAWPARGGHLDDEPWPGGAPTDASRTVHLEVAGSVDVLVAAPPAG